jgi:sugar lactone lactonase YvrE
LPLLIELVQPYLNTSCALGEGPVWQKDRRILRFVDINKRRLHQVEPDKGPESHRVVAELDFPIGHTAEVEGNDGVFVFGGKSGFGIFHPEKGTYEYVRRFWAGDEDGTRKERVMRANDGGVDARGRYWIGVMNDPLIEAPGPVGEWTPSRVQGPSEKGDSTAARPELTFSGSLFRLDPDLSLHKMLDGISIPNGITWTKDGRTLYVADSPTRNIYAFDYDLATGAISNRRVFHHVADPDGQPDGQALDESGHLWTAVFGLGRVLRLSPAGEVVASVALPTRCVTCPVFVDDWLYVTSAAEEEPERFPDSLRYQGAVFRCRVGVRGAEVRSFRMEGQAAPVARREDHHYTQLHQ